jgi:glucokinase
MTNTANFALAFDFGGTKLAASLINTATGTISNLIRLPAPAEQGADACFQAMVKTGSTILDSCAIPREEIKGIGISFGGIISDDGKSVVKSMHVKNWNNFPLPEKIFIIVQLPTYMKTMATQPPSENGYLVPVEGRIRYALHPNNPQGWVLD